MITDREHHRTTTKGKPMKRTKYLASTRAHTTVSRDPFEPIKTAKPKPKAADALRKARLRDATKVIKREAKIHIDAIGKHRDELRKLVDDYEELLETVGEGVEDVEAGLRQMVDGIDSISEQL